MGGPTCLRLYGADTSLFRPFYVYTVLEQVIKKSFLFSVRYFAPLRGIPCEKLFKETQKGGEFP